MLEAKEEGGWAGGAMRGCYATLNPAMVISCSFLELLLILGAVCETVRGVFSWGIVSLIRPSN